METREWLFSADWGTSAFRLRLVDMEKGACRAELKTEAGVAALYDEWQHNNDGRKGSQTEYMMDYLLRQAQQLRQQIPEAGRIKGMIVSGMASSSIGLQEVPYAAVPFRLDALDGEHRLLWAKQPERFPVVLLSGVRTADNVMRGEETQLIGLYGLAEPNGCALYILPGTHSKHILVENGAIVDFSTYLTGELFRLLATASVLKNSVSMRAMRSAGNDSGLRSFAEGVSRAQEAPLLENLFTVRARDLLEKVPAAENTLYLSGLLIGAELRGVAEKNFDQIIIAGSEQLLPLYEYAFQTLDMGEAVTAIAPQILDSCVMKAHVDIYKRLFHEYGQYQNG
jgi:2-dehydro-3-deoxygalactonokinase